MGLDHQGDCGLSIAEIRRSDPHAKEIIDGSHHVAIFTCNHETKKWLEAFPQASVFVYRRNVEPRHVLLISDNGFGSEDVVLLTADKEFKIDAPLLFYKDELGRIRCFKFETEDECNRIGRIIEQITQPIAECIPVRPQQMTNYVDVLAMLAKTQGVFDDPNQPNQINNKMSIPPTPSFARTTPTPSNILMSIFDVEDATWKHAGKEDKETVPAYESITPESSYICDTLSPFPDELNIAIPSFTRSEPVPSRIMNVLGGDNAEIEHPLSQVNEPVSSHALPRSNPATKQAISERLSTTLPISSSSMNIFDAQKNASAMAHAPYQVSKAIPSYAYITPESTQVMSPSYLLNAPQKRLLSTSSRDDRSEKRQKIAACFFQSTVTQTPSSPHRLLPKTVNLLSPYLQQEMENFAFERETVSSKIPSPYLTDLDTIYPTKPDLCSPLMFIKCEQLTKDADTPTLLASTENISSVNQSDRHDKSESSMEKPTVSKPSPRMFKPTYEACISTVRTESLSSGVFRVNKSEIYGKPEPLTQNQLLQAVNHLIKTDRGFVHKLHEAYLQSFVEILPKTS